MTRVHKLVVLFLNTCHIFIICIVVARRVAHKVQLHWISMYGWTCIVAPYIHVAYIVSHATECFVQLVLCNYTNLQLHVACNWISVANDRLIIFPWLVNTMGERPIFSLTFEIIIPFLYQCYKGSVDQFSLIGKHLWGKNQIFLWHYYSLLIPMSKGKLVIFP
jgi:hypothetical protein